MPEPELITTRELLRLVRQKTHRYSVAARAQTIAQVGQLSCKEGCAWCCYAKVCIDQGSGAMIALLLNEEGRWTPELVKRLEEEDELMTKTSHARWYGTRPCIFLDETAKGQGRCTVYNVRPAGCINTYSIQDPSACMSGDGGGQIQLADSNLTENLMPYHEALLRGAGETQTLLMTLPGAVLYGRAILEGAERPANVHRVAKETTPDGVNIWDHLDQTAGAR